MTSSAIASLFELVNFDDDDFPTLVEKFKIDLASDLRHCDLRNVDFGPLVAETLNLTGCLLEGADLSRVRCGNIIRDAKRSGSDEITELLKEVLLAVFRYQSPDWIVGRLLEHAEDSLAPALAFYDSSAEQDLLTKFVCKAFRKREDLYGVEGDRDAGIERFAAMDFLWFYTRQGASNLQLSPSHLDLAFINLIRESNKHDIGIYPSNNNQARIARVQSAIADNKSIDGYRTSFVRALKNQLKQTTVVLFSGFPPMSKKLYAEMRETLPNRFKLVFLCSSHFEGQFLAKDGAVWRKQAIPGYAIGKPIAMESDFVNLERRIKLASGSKVQIGGTTRNNMEACVDKPLSDLKKVLIKSIYELAATTPRSTASKRKSLIL